MEFTKDSAVVRYVWVPLIKRGIYTLDDVPIFLKEVVEEALNNA